MDCEERSLREMLCSPLGARAAAYLLGEIGRGEPVHIALATGEELILSELAQAALVLKERFGWDPDLQTRDSQTPKRRRRKKGAVDHVLRMCQALEEGFTLKEIIGRVVYERPELILDFAEIWGELIRSKA